MSENESEEQGRPNSDPYESDSEVSEDSSWDSSASDEEDDGKILVEVKSCTDQFWRQTRKEKHPYRMRSLPRGYALIVSNTKFTQPSKKRKGGDVDLSNITALFEGLSFNTVILQNRDAQTMEKKISEFSKREDHEQMDCCVVVLMSHGRKGVISGTDNKPVKLEDIFAMFDNNNCPHLKGKPKLFFVQACRGGNVDKGVVAPEDEDDSALATDLNDLMRSLLHLAASDEDEADEPEVIPTRTDMLCCYATQSGNKAFRGRKSGSWFIRAITKVFMKDAKDNSLLEMMTTVNADVSKQTASSTSNPSLQGGKAVAEFVSSLRKSLYFFPGTPCQEKSRPSAKQQTSPQPSCSSTTTGEKSSGATKRKYRTLDSSEEDSPGDCTRRLAARKSAAKGKKKTPSSGKMSNKSKRRNPTDDSSDSSSDEYSPTPPPKRQKASKSAERGKKRKSPTVDVSRYFDKVVRGVSADWDKLARNLNFEPNAIDVIERKKPDCDSNCWEVLKKWKNDRGEAATLEVLKKALVKSGHRFTAERLDDSSDDE